ncbi:MAG: divalent metal cation transporter [Acidobacteria bacterium]|nr:divalent metal cation transporter [Acidobacteriota bacterium]
MSIPILMVPVAVGIVIVQVWGSYALIVRIFKWLTITLFAYVIASFLAHPNWGEVAKATVMPNVRFDGKYITTIVAILGTTISPYLFFWQADQEVEEECRLGRTRLRQRLGATPAEMRSEKIDTVVGMVFCNLVFYFVILAAGATLFVNGQHDIQSATDAAQALRPLAGDFASVLFAVGLIGCGLLAIPVLSGSAAYAVAETFGWSAGLREKPHRAKKFYWVIAASTLVGLLINIAGVDPISALFWAAVINGIAAPPLLVVVMMIANNKKIMMGHTNGLFANIIGWTAVAFMFAAAIAMFVSWGQ